MRKILFFTILILFISNIIIRAQDTLNIDGRRYQFIPNKSDTIKNNGTSYIIKYVVEPELADNMRNNGKIYVVVLVLATIFAGIFMYLVYINRKITRLENEKQS